MIAKYLALIVGAALVFAVIFAVLLRFSPRLRLIDAPSGRKNHARDTPLIGGLAILAALSVGAVAFPNTLRDHLGYAIGAVGLTMLGALDDFRPVSARYKLLVQIGLCLAALIIDRVEIGQIDIVVLGVPLSLGGALLPFSLLVVLTIVNAINMIDGVDGLAGGMSFVAFAIILKAAIAGHMDTDATLLAVLFGGLGAFLLVNFPFRRGGHAKAFLGDAGSLLLGFSLAYFTVRLSAIPHRVFRPSTALWFFFIPVADTTLLYLRRTVLDRGPFAPGRDHLHHILLRRFSARGTTWILVAAASALAGLSYLAERLGIGPDLHVAGWIVLWIVYGALTQRSWKAAWLRSRRAERSRPTIVSAPSATTYTGAALDDEDQNRRAVPTS